MATKKPARKATKKATKKKATKKTATKKASARKGTKKKAVKKTGTKKAGTKKRATKAKKPSTKTTKSGAESTASTATATPDVDPAVAMGLVEEHNPNLDIPVKINKRDLKRIQGELLRIRAELTNDLDALTEQNLSNSGRDQSGDLSGYGFHMADVATDNWTREMELNIATGENNRLRLVEEALDRMNRGTYGRCDECGIPIDVNRLKVLPYALLCIDCAETFERG